jgi:hypothetical protein
MEIRAYSHPRVQACMLGCVLFLTVGMYNVITFLGGAGQQTAYLSDVANIALYTVFTVACSRCSGLSELFWIAWYSMLWWFRVSPDSTTFWRFYLQT